MTAHRMEVTGSCHCGAITFEATIDPAQVIACHCRDCQAFSGAPLQAVVPTPVGQVTLRGTPREYVKVAASGNRRALGFCETCGTQLFATEADGPRKELNLRLGCIAERGRLAPVVQIWGESCVPWLSRLAALPIHARGLSSPLMTERGGVPDAG